MRINEVFYSLQGEGARAGTVNVFVRFSGCNLTCSVDTVGFDCDTEFTSGFDCDLDRLDWRVKDVMPPGVKRKDVGIIFTGGEPLLQLGLDTLHWFQDFGTIAIETNGTQPCPPWSSPNLWISCSPKTAEHTLRVGERVNELRYVRRPGLSLPRPRLKADHYFISPAVEPDGQIQKKTLDYCVDMVRKNPPWRLSVQQHKTWGVR
jgi:organic radical activating enzyme